MKIVIKLMSDLCTCSGETYNSTVDTDVTFEENGIPYIAAKRIKGCIREAALEMKEFGIITQGEYEEVFGGEGCRTSAFSLSNAYPSDYENTVNALKKCPFKDLKSPQNVLNQYTGTRTQTAVDLETGVADKNSLRTIRVIQRGLTFEAVCSWNKKVSRPEILGQAVSLVKHMGMSRTRGLGLVNMKVLDSGINNNVSHVQFDKNQLTEKNKITYVINLKSPVICKSPQGNQAVTQDYIAGSKILGLIAGTLGKEAYQKLISREEELIVTNGYPVSKGKRCVPARISLQKKKDQPYEDDGTMHVTDMLLLKSPEEVKGVQMSPVNISYIGKDGTIAEVTTQISYHHQRPSDKSTGRATGKDGSSFYQLSAISAGQSFSGYIYADKAQAEQIMDVVSSWQEVRMGYGRTSEFGAVDITLTCIEPVNKKSEIRKDALVTLASDVLMYNEKGMLTTDIRVLENNLRELTGTSDLILSHPFLQFVPVGGYNVTWQCRKPFFYALGKGSTFRIHSETGFDISVLNRGFIGERVAEGYGELLAEELPESADVIVKKTKECDCPADRISVIDSDIVQKLLQSEFERRMQEKVRNELEKKKNHFRSNCEGLNAAVSRLRIIFKNENSYEDMKKQVDGIEKEMKNSLCKELIDLIRPASVVEAVTGEMKKDYTEAFENQWSEEILFRNVYRAYLTELKYFVKGMEKEGECRS